MPKSTPERILQRLDWHVIRKLDGVLQGNYRTLFWGQGLDLADIREYRIGDDVRAIDWNVTARMGTPYVREFLEDREITAWFLVDLSPSVDFGSVERMKRDLLIDCITTLARLLTRRGNKVGAILYDSQVERVIPAGSSTLHLLMLIHELLQTPPLAHAPVTRLGALLEAACRAIRRRSQIFVLSDFLSLPGWDQPLGMLAQRHDVMAVHITDPTERELPDIGEVTVEDAETGEQLDVDAHDPELRERYRQIVAQHVREMNAACRRAGVDVLELSTAEDLVQALARFIIWRKQRRLPATSLVQAHA